MLRYLPYRTSVHASRTITLYALNARRLLNACPDTVDLCMPTLHSLCQLPCSTEPFRAGCRSSTHPQAAQAPAAHTRAHGSQQGAASTSHLLQSTSTACVTAGLVNLPAAPKLAHCHHCCHHGCHHRRFRWRRTPDRSAPASRGASRLRRALLWLASLL